MGLLHWDKPQQAVESGGGTQRAGAPTPPAGDLNVWCVNKGCSEIWGSQYFGKCPPLWFICCIAGTDPEQAVY